MAPKKPKKQDQERAKGVGSGQDGSLEEQIKTILRRLRARDEGVVHKTLVEIEQTPLLKGRLEVRVCLAALLCLLVFGAGRCGRARRVRQMCFSNLVESTDSTSCYEATCLRLQAHTRASGQVLRGPLGKSHEVLLSPSKNAHRENKTLSDSEVKATCVLFRRKEPLRSPGLYWRRARIAAV
eukprot:2638209-Rhodomonas_salina.2